MPSSWFDGGSSGKQVDPVELLDEHVVRGVGELVGGGALVSLGLTSDGGAMGFTVTLDGAYRREYVRSAEELHALLAEAIPAVVEGGRAPSRPSSGSRRRRK
jgi:hypothetical protein